MRSAPRWIDQKEETRDANGTSRSPAFSVVFELHVTDGGSFVYVFRGFLSEAEKLSAKSPMEL